MPRRRIDLLLGAACTTLFIAFPLGPGATAAAYTGVRVAAFASPLPDGQTTDIAAPLLTAPTSGPATGLGPDAGPAHGPQRNEHGPQGSGHRPEGAGAHSAIAAGSAGARLAEAVPGDPSRPRAGDHEPGGLPRTNPGPAPGTAEQVPAARHPAGAEATPGGIADCGSGSSAKSESSTGSAGRLIPVLGALVRTLLRLAPQNRPVPALSLLA